MPWKAAPAAPRCPACKTPVFTAEAVMASDRQPFHKSCVKCKTCHKLLTAATLNEHKNNLYCGPCYEEIFNPSDYICDIKYGGIVTPEDLLRAEEEEKKRKAKIERAKREKRCPTCDMRVYPDNCALIGETFFHKHCLKCTDCGRGPDNDTPMMLGPKGDSLPLFGGEDEELDPYCKFCFCKKYHISALDVRDAVTTLLEYHEDSGLGL